MVRQSSTMLVLSVMFFIGWVLEVLIGKRKWIDERYRTDKIIIACS